VELIVRQWRRQLADGTTSHEARRLGGGCRGSLDRWWRPWRAGNTVEGGRGEHSRVREGSVVGTAARDRAARWKRIRAREGTVENFFFLARCGREGAKTR
jgi:transposase-like protein